MVNQSLVFKSFGIPPRLETGLGLGASVVPGLQKKLGCLKVVSCSVTTSTSLALLDERIKIGFGSSATMRQ